MASGKRIKVTMKEIDKKCFTQKHIYQIRIVNNGKKEIYETSKPVFTTKKMKKGQYKVSYRVMREKTIRVGGKVKVEKTYKAVTSFTNAVKVTI